ncbi:hypothetical protein Tco_1022042 [Tanacetum coccineum]
MTPPPINTEATTITTSLPEITPFIALQLRVARLEQEMSEVKKTDHSADVFNREILLCYTGPDVLSRIKNQKRCLKEIIKPKREQDEDKQDSTYSNQRMKTPWKRKFATDKGKTIRESMIVIMMKTMNEMKPFSMDQKPGSYHPQLDGQITDDNERCLCYESSITALIPESGHSEQSQMTNKADERNDSGYRRTLDNAHIPKVSTTTWFKPIPESERPATPEPEWTIPPNDFPKPEHNWANAYATTFKVPRKTSFKGRRMILGRSSNGSADELERRSSAKLI